MFDANGVLYYRNTKRLQVFEDFLIKNSHTKFPSRLDVISKMETQKRNVEIGEGTLDNYYNSLLDVYELRDKILRANAIEALHEADSKVYLYETVKSSLKEMQTRGYRLCIITNAMASTRRKLQWLNSAGLPSTLKLPTDSSQWMLPKAESIENIIFWDAIINSCEVGFKKPNPKIYFAALEALNIEPHDGAFIGHEQSELDGAAAVGLLTVAIDDSQNKKDKQQPLKADYSIQRMSDLLKIL